MDITITIRGLEELGLGLSALAATLPETARQLATLGRHNGTGANDVSTAALQPPAQLPQTPERPTPAQNAASTQNKTEPPRQPTLEDVRAVLAQKSAEDRASDIHALLDRYGAKKLSAVDPARYAELLRDAEAL